MNPRSGWRQTARTAGVLLLTCGLVSGCQSSPRANSGREYPAAKGQGASLNIQVTRNVTTVSFTNTTAQDLPAGVIWANSGYSRDFPGLGIGDSITLQLSEFRNRFDEAFRAGGFFATERPDALVRVQIESEKEMIGLTVIAAVEE